MVIKSMSSWTMWLQSEGAQTDLYNVCFSSHSHLQPVLPEAPALQHPALLTGSHHRPGRGRPLLLLDVEAPQTGVPSCPRPHTCKSHQSPAHHCFNPGLSLSSRLLVAVVWFQRSPVSHTAWRGCGVLFLQSCLLMQLVSLSVCSASVTIRSDFHLLIANKGEM